MVRCKRLPVTKVAQISPTFRTASLKRLTAAKKDTANLNSLQYPLIISEYEPTLKGCAVGARR